MRRRPQHATTMGSDRYDRHDGERSPFMVVLGMGCLALVGFLVVVRGVFVAGSHVVEAEVAYETSLSVATWNVAAINNNPFEYWITHHDPAYNSLMEDVQRFVDEPGDRDVPVSDVFTESMFGELKASMEAAGWAGLDVVERVWRDDFRHRKIISGFVKDGTLGKKRLASMPDRVTNTIKTFDGAAPSVAYRPTVINCYGGGDLGDAQTWWARWRAFVFDADIAKAPGGDRVKVYTLFNPIKRSKYPALTEEEERVSIPLQTLAGAIFDGVLVHMMNVLSPTWQALRADMCDKLNRRKDERTLDILATTYKRTDVLFLQEAASSFVAAASANDLGRNYHVIAPSSMDGSRDQNSLVLLKKSRFPDRNRVAEFSDAIVQRLPKGTAAPGDLVALSAVDANDKAYVFASFHGDTNGIQTMPVTDAVHAHVRGAGDSELRAHALVFGLDANTYKVERDGYQGVLPYQADIVAKGMASQRGDTAAIDPAGYTTFNARTYLQPQLNKAVSFAERYTNLNVDHNPKDFILFYRDQLALASTAKDNTGKRRYDEDIMFPTLDFPSDHGISSAVLTVL